MHHYNMPPHANGETGRVGSPKRREVGHGLLAERALLPVIPTMDEWPYTFRLVSEVLASNGSTSMASVCSSSLSLMDGGVPIKAAVAGIAMGLVYADGKYTTLTDILGAEDAFGDMDFKVAGTRDFITALQLDTKIDGLPADVLADALAQAKDARTKILDVMDECIAEPRDDVQGSAPKIISFEIPVDKIGEVIGPKGKVINQIQGETGADIGVDDDGMVGVVTIGGTDKAAVDEARRQIELIVNPPSAHPGEIYMGRVVNITKFGAFVNILPGRDGLLHISKIGGKRRIDRVEDELELGQEIEVRVDDIDPNGKISLSPTNVPEGDEADDDGPKRGAAATRGGSDRGGVTVAGVAAAIAATAAAATVTPAWRHRRHRCRWHRLGRRVRVLRGRVRRGAEGGVRRPRSRGLPLRRRGRRSQRRRSRSWPQRRRRRSAPLSKHDGPAGLDPEPRTTTLANGVRVVSDAMPHARSVTTGVWVAVGGRDEAPELAGASHFLEHLFFKGTEARSARSIAEAVDAVGGDMNAFTAREHTTFVTRLPAAHWRLGIELIGDILSAPALRPHEIDAEREVILEELWAALDTPEDRVHTLHMEGLFPGHPLGREVLGDEDTVRAMTRDDILGFFETHYRPANLVVAAAGRVDHDELCEVVAERLGGGDGGTRPARRRRPSRSRPLRTQVRDGEQVHVILGWRGLPLDHDDRYALHVADQVLGGGSSSRLFQAIREERGLAYSVYSWVSSYSDAGLLGVYAGTSPGRSPQLLDVLESEIDAVLVRRRHRRRGAASPSATWPAPPSSASRTPAHA